MAGKRDTAIEQMEEKSAATGAAKKDRDAAQHQTKKALRLLAAKESAYDQLLTRYQESQKKIDELNDKYRDVGKSALKDVLEALEILARSDALSKALSEIVAHGLCEGSIEVNENVEGS